jgi:hypothetical protein
MTGIWHAEICLRELSDGMLSMLYRAERVHEELKLYLGKEALLLISTPWTKYANDMPRQRCGRRTGEMRARLCAEATTRCSSYIDVSIVGGRNQKQMVAGILRAAT